MASLIQSLQTKTRQTTALFFGMSAVAGLILLTIFLLPRSEPSNRLFLGLSPARFSIGIIFLVLLLADVGATLLAVIDFAPWQRKLEAAAAAFFLKYRTAIMVFLYALMVLSGAFLLLVIPPIIRPLAFLESVGARLGSFAGWIFLTAALYIVLLRLLAAEVWHNDPLIGRLDAALTLICLFLVTFVLYAHIAALIGWVNKTRYSYWNLLAGELLQGKLYLEKPPYTHDLTMYKGRWYIPMPPLPAILMMPLAYWIGAGNISTSYLSMVFSAANGVLLFLILKQIANYRWIDLSTVNIVLLVTLFLFGTPHLWVGLSGRAWFVSQILTVMFLALAVYAALRSWSPWWVGTFMALAVLTRPNALMTWPFLLAISIHLQQEKQGRISPKQILGWSLKTALPVLGAVAGLLVYNYLRFENLMDFGYTTINGGPDIVRNAQTYGIFSTHFVVTNLKVMFFRMPRIHWGGRWPVEPSTTGMSIFLTTPALIYLFRRYQKRWWIIGAWLAVFFNVLLLSLYHNTGAHQFGYRYILDMLVPIITLLAIAVDRKVRWHFILLVLISIAINLYGAYWFMNG